MPTEQKRKRLERIRDASAWAGLGFVLFLGVGFAVMCFRTAPTEDDASLSLAVLAASTILGWLAGTLMSPGTAREEARFGATARAISTFASGYLLAKADRLVDAVLAPQAVLASPTVLPAFRLAMAVTAFAGVFLHTYILRVYILLWVPPPATPTSRPDRPRVSRSDAALRRGRGGLRRRAAPHSSPTTARPAQPGWNCGRTGGSPSAAEGVVLPYPAPQQTATSVAIPDV